MNDRETIKKIIESQKRIHDRNFDNYQQTGERRYERAYQNAEDLIDICTLALGGVDEHTKLIHLRSSICEVGYKAMCLLNNDSFLTDPTETKKLLNNLRALAKGEGVRDPYEEKGASK